MVREDIAALMSLRPDLDVRLGLPGVVEHLRSDEILRAAAWGYCQKWGLVVATTERFLFQLPKKPPTGPDYMDLQSVDVVPGQGNYMELHLFGETKWLPIERILDKGAAERVAVAANEGIDEAGSAGPALRMFGIAVTADALTSPWGGGPIQGARAAIETAGAISERPRLLALATLGVAGLAFRKKQDNRELYLTVEGAGYGFVVPLPPERINAARAFAVRLNGIAAAQPAIATAADGPPDPLAQLRTLGDMHAEGLITDEEFAAKRAEILRRM